MRVPRPKLIDPDASIGRVIRQLIAICIAAFTVLILAATLQGDILALVRGAADSRYLIGILLLLYLVRVFFAIPTSLVTIFVGFEFGLFGVAIAAAGNLVSTFPTFLLGRYSEAGVGPLRWVRHSAESFVDTTGDVRSVFAASISPVPLDIVAYTAGTTKLPLWRFLLGTVLGDIPWVILYVSLGMSMRQFSRDGTTTPLWAVLAATVVSILVVRQYFGQTLRAGD